MPRQEGDSIQIGFAAGVSGNVANLGIDERNGAELAAKDFAEVKGFAVKMVAEDSLCSGEGGTAVANKFAANPQIVGVVGHMCSSSSIPASGIYEKAHIVMISPSSTAVAFTARGLAVTNRVCWNDAIQGAQAAKYVKDSLGVSKVAILHDGSAYGQGLVDVFKASFEKMDGTITDYEAITVGDKDFRAVLTKIAANKPELIYFGGFQAEGALLVQQKNEVGLKDALFFSDDGTKSDQYIEAAAGAAEGSYASFADFPAGSENLAAFKDKYEKAYNAKAGELGPFNAHAYDAMAMMVAAINKVAVVDDAGNLEIGRKALADAVRGTKDYAGVTGNISCDDKGDCGTGTVVVNVVKDGKWAKAGGEAKPATGKADTIIVGTTDKVTVLDPADSYDFHTWEIHHNTMDTLLHYVPGTTDLEPGLATAMPEVSDDGLEYTFHLVKDVKFPDGTAFNADAVKWSIDRVIALEGDPNWLVTSFVDHVEAVDDNTVKFVLKAPVNYFPLLVATQPYSPISPNCYSKDKIDADSTCGGIGPYKITKWERDVELDLEAYDGYPGNKSVTPKIIVKYYSDPTTMRLAAESGEIDVATKTLNPTDYTDLKAAGKLQVIEGPGAQIRYICINNTTAPFDQAGVRQALSYAVDRNAITSIAFQGTHVPLYSMVPMGMWSHTDTFPKRDLAQAKDLLTKAGFSADNKLKMDLWWTPTHYGPTEADLATVLKDNLEETGLIEVNLQNTEWATYKKYMNAGSMPVFLLGWYPDYLDPDNYTSPFAESTASGDIGIFYASDKMDALIADGRKAAELRSDARKKVYEDIQSLWVQDVPTTPLTQGSLLVVAQPGVSGIVLDPNMLFHYFLLKK